MEREYFLDLIPAYALDALDEEERAEFEALLTEDPEAQTLLAEYQALTESLVLAVPGRQAPAHLGDDLLRRIKDSSPAVSEAAPPAPAPRLLRRRRWLPATAAAVLVALIGLVFALTQLQPEQQSYYQRAKGLYEQLAATEGVSQWSVAPADDFVQVEGQLLANPADNTAVLMVNNLPVLSEDQAYQLWFVTAEGTVSSGGVYSKTREGPTYLILDLDQPFEQYQRFGCSLEPAGGSPFPDRRSGPGVFRVEVVQV